MFVDLYETLAKYDTYKAIINGKKKIFNWKRRETVYLYIKLTLNYNDWS